METIAVEGAQLSALALGSADAPPVAMLHGLVSGNMASWYSPIATPLSGTQRVLLYDQRGHGGSTVPRCGFDLDTQARDLQAVLAHFGCGAGPVDLVGHSMGALIALRFALRQPQRVRRLVLVDAPMPACEFVAPSLRDFDRHEALAAFVARDPAVAGGAKGRRRERLQQRLTALFLESTLLRDLAAMAAEPDALLAGFDRPVLLLYGRHSPCLAAAHHLQGLLPQAELQLLEAGHYLPEEAPQAVYRHLQRFLAPPPPLLSDQPVPAAEFGGLFPIQPIATAA
jgi:pimeloyl-ACP methyl ester carboxylesterase